MKILTNLDFNKNQALKLVIQNLATEPTDPKQGMVYYNTTDNRMYYYDGKKWVASDSKDIKLDPSSIKGLDKILEKKVDAEDGKGLISKEEKEKLERLKEFVIEDLKLSHEDGASFKEEHSENGIVSTSHLKEVIETFYYLLGEKYLDKLTVGQDIEKAKTESKNYAKGLIDTLVGSGTPETLDTLKEIANALGNDPNFTTTLLNKIGEKTKKVVKTIGDASKNVIKVTHNLNTRDVGITVRTTASPYEIVYTDVEFTDSNNITLKFANAPKKDEYTVVVIG